MRLARETWSRTRTRDESRNAWGSKERSPCAALPLVVIVGFGLLLLSPNLWETAAPTGFTQAVAKTSLHGPITPIEPMEGLDRRKVALGRALFHDLRLSAGGDTSCSTCHDLSTNGARSGPRKTELDTPTVFNVGFNFRYGWAGRFRSLEAHVLASMENRMMVKGIALETIAERFGGDRAMRHAFRAAYRRDPDIDAIADAIATFERSLATPNSRFDRWLRGERGALSQREVKGYELFQRLGCGSCHQGRNVGGNLYQRQGIFRRLASPEPAVVRVPSLRNIAVTAPYFHDGSAPTLEAAVHRMGSAQLNQDLTPEEVRLIAAYLRTLTGTYEGRPLTARP